MTKDGRLKYLTMTTSIMPLETIIDFCAYSLTQSICAQNKIQQNIMRLH